MPKFLNMHIRGENSVQLPDARRQELERRTTLESAPAPLHERAPEPQLAIVEKYQLVTLAGAFGPGPVVRTIQQQPHEKRTHTIRLSQKKATSGTVTTSALESNDSAVSKSLSDSVRSSQGSQHASDASTFAMDASFHGEVSTLSQSADANVSVSSNSSSVRDEFRSSVDSAVDQQVSNTDAYRKVSQASETQTMSTQSEEVRTETYSVENPTDETVTFMMFQLSRERVTALCLVDVELVFYNPRTGQTVRKSIGGTDELLADIIADPEHRAQVRAMILQQMSPIFDCMHQPRRMVEEFEYESRKYLRVVPELKTEVKIDRGDGAVGSFTFPGIALNKKYRVMMLPHLGMGRASA